MAIDIYFENVKIVSLGHDCVHSDSSLKKLVSTITGVAESDLYGSQDGRPLTRVLKGAVPVRFAVRLRGGKGGFGSMLRAIGAQIEKTTNREACRDLSGRRLRDIREEQALREWAAARAQRTQDANRKKEERLKRLCAVPSHEFHDPQYEEARRRLEEDGGAALEAGARKRSPPPAAASKAPASKKRKPNLWIDEDVSDMSSSESGCEEEVESDKSEASCSTAGSVSPSYPHPITPLHSTKTADVTTTADKSDSKI